MAACAVIYAMNFPGLIHLSTTLLLLALASAHPDPRHTLEQLDEHLAASPDDAAILQQKTDILLSTGNPELAGPVVAKLLSLGPEDPQNLLLDARLAIANQDSATALAKANALVATHPKFAAGWDFLAGLHFDAGRRDEAITAKRRFLELEPHPGPSDVMSCAAWLRDRGQTGDAAAAITLLDQGLTRMGCLTGLHNMAIEIELRLGRYDASLRRIDALAARFRPSVDLSLRRADILEQAGRYQEAAAACDSALALLDVLPPSRKKGDLYQQRFDAVAKRKAGNLALARGD